MSLSEHEAPDTSLPEHVQENRTYWDGMADAWVSPGERSWKSDVPFWGLWALPEAQLNLLPDDMTGMDAIELGCGTGYVSGWMARRGATVVGIDNSAEQLATAKRLMEHYGIDLTLVHGNAEHVPYPDAAFDFAISEYGAAIWCDPKAWIPETHRLLKPGGHLTFLGHHPFSVVCTPLNGADTNEHLHQPYFGMHQQDWRTAEDDPGGIEFNLTHADWLALFRETGFDVLDYLELQAPTTETETKFGTMAEWAQKWPSEQVWKLRKQG